MKRRSFIKGALVGGSVLGVNLSATEVEGQNTTFDNVEVGDEQIKVALVRGPEGIKEHVFSVDGKEMTELTSFAWAGEIDGSLFVPSGEGVRLVGSDGGRPARRAIFQGAGKGITWRLSYEVSAPGRITKSLQLTTAKDATLRRVVLWNGRTSSAPLIARTKLQEIAAFYRQNKIGLFVSLDFPYSNIKYSGGTTEVSYLPYLPLKSNQAYTCHSLTFGKVRLEGVERYGFDVGEVAALDAYVQERYQPRFERPMFVSASINNRYTQVEDDHIFYTMKDHPTLTWNTDILKRELALMPQLGIEYYQVFPGIFDWVPGDPPPERVDEMMNVARSHGVRMGDYSAANVLFCPHYNEYGKSLDRPNWLMHNQDGRPDKGFCFGVKEFVDLYLNTVVKASKRFGFEVHCLDFLNIKPCYASNHNHPVGPDSVYHQVAGLINLLQAINTVSPQMMTWSNSGNWQEFLPKIAWFNPNLYLTDPFINTEWQGLNMTRLLDDARREQMVSLHHSHFIPYRFLTNCQYFFSQNSIVPDIRNFEYGFLSTVAVTPNLTLGEIRPWLDKLSSTDAQHVIDFYQRWTDFLNKNFDLWRKTYQSGENPGVGAVEVYSHADGNRGYIFLINPQYWDRTVPVTLDESLGFTKAGDYELEEIYPVKRLRLTATGPTVNQGATLPMRVPAQQVVVLEVKPAPTKIDMPRMYGLPGTIEQTTNGYLIKTFGPQGRSERVAVLLPPHETIATAEVRNDVPAQPKRLWKPTPLSIISNTEKGLMFDVTFRRAAAPTELREWKVQPGTFDSGSKRVNGFADGQSYKFPLFADVRDQAIKPPFTDAAIEQVGLGPLANFCGAYVDNAFSETQETWIELKKGSIKSTQADLSSVEKLPDLQPLPRIAKDQGKEWWLQTDFHLPFLHTLGAEPFFDEHTILVLPLLRRSKLREIKAWINGQPLAVSIYHYPRNRKLATYYADLVGSGARGGDNRLVIHLQY